MSSDGEEDRQQVSLRRRGSQDTDIDPGVSDPEALMRRLRRERERQETERGNAK